METKVRITRIGKPHGRLTASLLQEVDLRYREDGCSEELWERVTVSIADGEPNYDEIRRELASVLGVKMEEVE